MALTLHQQAVDQAKRLIEAGKVVLDEKDAWSEDQPTTDQEHEFIKRHGFSEYGKWHLGIDEQEPEDTKGRYKFPYGDFSKVHRCGLLAAETRSGQYKYADIEKATKQLLSMLGAAKEKQGSAR